ncbi:7972_t:CDS:2, partial [Cetraspora pellucida]
MSQVDTSPVHSAVPLPPIQPPDPTFPTKLMLELRGTRFEIDRELLMSLPESILIVMFPNGLILDDQIIFVDFDPLCLEYILNFYKTAQDAFYSNQESSSAFPHIPTPNPLLNKQAIIVLREELDYFTIPPKSKKKLPSSSSSPLETDKDAVEMSTVEPTINIYELKTECGTYLLHQRKIFTALQRNVNKENNVAEQHLIDMLCVSGFSRDDEWGYRNIEPHKTSIVSIALVILKTTGQNQMATAQKLLLFWRKPARKCWWDGLEVTVGEDKAIP